MVKIHILASRVMRVQQEMVANMTRLQSGFMPRQSLQQAKEKTEEIRKMLLEIEDAYTHPQTYQSQDHVPLK